MEEALTLFLRFFYLSVLCNPLTKKKIVKFVIFLPLIFLNCENSSDLADVPASIYDKKTAARRFDIIHDVLRCLSLAKSLLKSRNIPILRQREPTQMALSETEGLKSSIQIEGYLTGRFPTVSHALVPARAKLAHFGRREEAAQD